MEVQATPNAVRVAIWYLSLMVRSLMPLRSAGVWIGRELW
jgi:hypothetical protein